MSSFDFRERPESSPDDVTKSGDDAPAPEYAIGFGWVRLHWPQSIERDFSLWGENPGMRKGPATPKDDRP